MESLKVAIVHPWNQAKELEPLLHDGLHAAIKLVGQKHQVDWFLAGDEPDDSYDWIIPWGVGSLPFNYGLDNYHARKALLCAGHPDDRENLGKFEAVFVESPAVYDQMKPYCKKIVLAFGTDTDFFKPTQENKMFDAFFPATFSPWKRQRLFASAIRERGLVGGFMQPDGVADFVACEQSKTHTLVGLIPTIVVAKLYNMSRSVVVTAWHGSERTCLEAMSSNIPLVVVKDNPLACSLLTDECIQVDPDPDLVREAFQTAITKTVNTRDHIIKNYSHHTYAQKILEVIES